MKTFIRSFKLIQAGFLLGTFFWMWVMSEEEKKKSNSLAGENPSKFDEIYNSYKEKQNA